MGFATQCLMTLCVTHTRQVQTDLWITSSSSGREQNRPFPSNLVPLFQNEYSCKTFLMKISLICMKMNLLAELIE